MKMNGMGIVGLVIEYTPVAFAFDQLPRLFLLVEALSTLSRTWRGISARLTYVAHLALRHSQRCGREIVLEVARGGVGPFERCAGGHVEDQEHLVLVVVGQLLNLHAPGQHQQNAADT